MRQRQHPTLPPNQFIGGQARAAFTLIELLVVMAIIGIIGALGVSTYIRESRVAAVRQAAIQLQADLETLRSSTIRYNSTSEIILATDGKGYNLSIATGSTPTVVTRTFENGIIATRPATASDAIYTPPLSTVGATALKYTLTLGDKSYYIKVIGVTGRAVFSASE